MDQRDDEFATFVAARSPSLLRYAYLLTGNHAEAEDLLQSTLVKVYLAWNRISDRGSLDGYVRTALTRNHVSWWRKVGRREFATEVIPDRAVSGRYDIDERDAMWSLLQTLGPRQRAVVVLRYYEDLPEAQIAEVLGCSVGTVKSQLSRALANLRATMTDDAASGRGQ